MSKKVLIIDDEKDILEAVQIILETYDYEVITLSSFEDAKDLSQYNADLILLDFLLVGKTGKDVCEALKKEPTTMHVPIIVLSAHPLSKLKTFISPHDVVGYIQKPFEMDVLLAAVGAAVQD
jgi:DNA-binding response OmpR family regulator